MLKLNKGTELSKEVIKMNGREETLQYIKELCLMNDKFMSKCFEDIACTELLLHIILEKNDLQVHTVLTQHQIKNLQGRSVTLDIYATDSTGKKYNIEVQRTNAGAIPKRARYNSSLLDANITNPGDRYENLDTTYIIFITENDVLGGGLPIYHIERTIQETKTAFGDDTYIIYVNAAYESKTALGRLMHDFFCKNPSDMYYEKLAERVRYFKEDTEGVDKMTDVFEIVAQKAAQKAAQEATQKATQKATQETKQKIARSMLANGMTLEDIAKCTELSIEEIKALAEEM